MAVIEKNKIKVQKTKNKNLPSSSEVSVPVRHDLVKLFWMLGPAFTRWAEKHMDQEGLTPQRVRLMALLMENGPMMMSQLRNELGVTSTNITALVDVLEADGMVARKPHATDRRATLIALSAKAEKRMTENCSEFKERVSEIFAIFSSAEQKQLRSFLDRIRMDLIKRNILKESNYCTAAKNFKDKN